MSDREPPEAAPVVSERGVWGAIPHAFDEFGPGAGVRDIVYLVATVLFAVVLAGWLAAFSATQATSNEVAFPALERAVVALTEIDGLLDLHADDLEEQTTGTGTIVLPGFPLDIEVAALEVVTAGGDFDRALFRAALLRESAELLREQGSSAFSDTDGVLAGPSRFSSAGLMQALIDGLTVERHDRWSGFVQPLRLLALVLGAAMLVLGVGFGRFIHLGGAMIAAGAFVLVPALVLRIAIDFVGDDDVIGDEARAIASTLTNTPLRNAVILALAGAAIAIPAAILEHLFEGSDRRAAPRPAAPSAGRPAE